MKDQLKWDYFDQGLDLFDEEEYQKALEFFEKALKIDPALENAIAYKSFAITELKSLTEALKYIESQIEEYPDYASIYYLKANILSDLERFKESNDYLDLALKNGFEEEVTYYTRAYNYLGLGDCENSIPFFEKHLKTYVDDIQSWCQMGNCLNSLSRFEEALKCSLFFPGRLLDGSG
jgi:tetratricopeptide (TPR) repeat protein